MSLKPPSRWTPKQQGVVLLVVMLLLCGAGIGKWVYDTWGPGDAQGGGDPGVPSVEPVAPVPAQSDGGGASDEGGDMSDGGGQDASGSDDHTDQSKATKKKPSQDKSAKAALNAVVPKWGSLAFTKTGPDADQWVATWRDTPGASSTLVTQSRDNFANLWSGAARLKADAKVDSLKEVKKVWEAGDSSGWDVTMERKLTNDAGVDETETIAWEFTVKQSEDGQSEVVSFTEPDDED